MIAGVGSGQPPKTGTESVQETVLAEFGVAAASIARGVAADDAASSSCAGGVHMECIGEGNAPRGLLDLDLFDLLDLDPCDLC